MQTEPRVSNCVSEQLLAICCRNTARSAPPLMIAILLTFFLLNGKVNDAFLQSWALLTATLVIIRAIMLRMVKASTSLSHPAKRLWATILTFILGCSFTSVLYCYGSIELFERSMLLSIMLGLCAAAYTINIGYPPLVIAFIGPLLATSCVLWIIHPANNPNGLFSITVGATIAIFGYTLVRNGNFMFKVFSLAIESQTKLEEQSQRLSEALLHAEDAKQAAETSSQSKTRFIAAASHDLRQPVHVLNLFSGALRNAPLDTRTRDIVDNMNVAVTSLSSQLNSLLDISELDSGSVKPVIKNVDLFELAHILMSEMKKLAENKNIELLNEVPPSTYVLTDPTMLSQIIRNLCGNAIKYTHAGSVRLQASTVGSNVILSIADTGIGIEKSDSNKVFEEFYQVANHTREKEQGLGLGLSIVERLINTLEHRLSLESRLGEGTIVNISMNRGGGNNYATVDTSSTAHNPICTLPKGFWVHLVDDEMAVQNGVTAFLESIGAKVSFSESSASAIDFLARHRPDALLIDLRLRDGDSGLAVVDSITDPTLPIALITGESIEETGLAEKYPQLLMQQKPVSDDALLELLSYMLTSNQEELVS